MSLKNRAIAYQEELEEKYEKELKKIMDND